MTYLDSSIKKIFKSNYKIHTKKIYLYFLLDWTDYTSRFGLVFSGLARFFLVWLGFFRFDSVFFPGFFCLSSVRFFRFQAYKTEPVGFFKFLISLIGFFTVRFFRFFFNFLNLINFLFFLFTPITYIFCIDQVKHRFNLSKIKII
jgi:hypothetical protein